MFENSSGHVYGIVYPGIKSILAHKYFSHTLQGGRILQSLSALSPNDGILQYYSASNPDGRFRTLG